MEAVPFQVWCAASIFLLSAPAAMAAGDVKHGARLFGQCMACHSIQPGEHQTGPSLAHVWNHKAGTVEGFMRYSDAIKRSGTTWNEATLDKWLVKAGDRVTFRVELVNGRFSVTQIRRLR